MNLMSLITFFIVALKHLKVKFIYFNMNLLSFKKLKNNDFEIYDLNQINNKSLIYGESNHEDVLDIVKSIKFSNMLDVGSGYGKLTIFISKKLNVYVDGIEIDKKRYEQSLNILENNDVYDKVSFINDNFQNLYFGSYDLLYCCNLVFEDNDNEILYNKILKEFSGTFILFEYNSKLVQFFLYKKIIECTWCKSVEIFVFKK